MMFTAQLEVSVSQKLQSVPQCSINFVSPPAAAEETVPCALQHCGPVHSLGSEDQEN